jgi:ring-1,2-phenylacetyl-CoA epoxidase subunit PaaD
MVSEQSAASLSESQAWAILGGVLDPEVPVLSVVELGIVRNVVVQGSAVCVTVTPTYSGCPATEVIGEAIVSALKQAGAEEVIVQTRLTPAWTTDWIAPEAAEKLRHYGIAPPHLAGQGLASQPLRFHPRDLNCPRCDSTRTEQLSAFGSTACKALFRCIDCFEPFEYFKPL